MNCNKKNYQLKKKEIVILKLLKTIFQKIQMLILAMFMAMKQTMNYTTKNGKMLNVMNLETDLL